MRRFNQLLAQVRENRNKQYSKEVEDSTSKILAERYKVQLGVRRKNSRKRRRHVLPDSGAEDEEDDDNSVFPEDELILLSSVMEQV
jgi:hypothetical protein